MSDGINLIDKDDTWSIFLGFTKEITDARGTDTDKHFSKFGTRDGEEWNVCFTSDGASHQGFTSTWLTSEKDATWDLGTKFFVFLWILQEVDDFA